MVVAEFFRLEQCVDHAGDDLGTLGDVLGLHGQAAARVAREEIVARGDNFQTALDGADDMGLPDSAGVDFT